MENPRKSSSSRSFWRKGVMDPMIYNSAKQDENPEKTNVLKRPDASHSIPYV
jgi:hypothetical protein